MNWKTFVANYLTFSKKERLAALLVVGTLLFLYLLPAFLSAPAATAVQEDTTLSRWLDTATKLANSNRSTRTETSGDDYRYEISKNTGVSEGALFAFDPNTLDASGWKKLGLRDRTVRTIINYRSKGGHFYKPQDLQKIWGLPAGFYERVKNYVQIADAKTEDQSNTNIFKTPYEKSERRIAIIDVNNADTSTLIRLPGIGSKLAQRIVNFRDKLGGFYSTDQIGETYGLPDSTFQKLKPYLQVHGDLKKLNLNTATKDDLKTHPYIRWNLANALVEYRNQHGPFKKLDELKNIALVDEATYKKIVPYVTIE